MLFFFINKTRYIIYWNVETVMRQTSPQPANTGRGADDLLTL